MLFGPALQDHPTADKIQGRLVESAPGNPESAISSFVPPPATTGPRPTLPTSSGLPQASGSPGPTEGVGHTVKESALKAGVGESSHDGDDREGAGEHDEGEMLCEVAKLRLALRKAEERARLSERALSEEEERRRREEARARCLEQRVNELEKLLSAKAESGNTPGDIP